MSAADTTSAARFDWVAWNIVRALASTAALACLGRALLLHGRK